MRNRIARSESRHIPKFQSYVSQDIDEKPFQLIEILPDAVIISREDGTIVVVNKQAEELFGYKRDEIAKQSIEILMPERFRNNHVKEREEYNIKPSHRPMGSGLTLYALHKNGTEFPVDISLSLFETEEGLFIISSIRDITERKQTEEKLLLHTEIITNIHEGVFLIRAKDGVIIFTNPAFEKMFGYAPNEMLGKQVSILNAPTDKTPEETATEIITELNTSGQWKGEIQNIKKDGTLFWCYAQVNLFEHPEHGPAWVTVHTDITKRKKAEKAVMESEEKYKSIFENNLFGIASTSGDKARFLKVNPAFCRLLGYSEDELYQMAMSDITLPEDVEKSVELIEKLKNREIDQFTIEKKYRKKDGKILIARTSVKAIYDEQGKYTQSIATIEDITERIKYEKDMKNYQARLKSLVSQLTVTEERERRNIAADLHDHIGQSLALARVQIVNVIKSSSDPGMKAMLDDISKTLLETARDTRSLIFELSSPSMNEIGLGAAISEWLEDQIGKRHDLKTEFIDHIEGSQRKILDQDIRAILFRNVRELLTNVVKHAQANKVKVNLEGEGDTVRVLVQDDGVGFAPHGFSSGVKYQDGFGLFSIQERMAELGGSLEVQSEPGKGCKAILTIPRALDIHEERE